MYLAPLAMADSVLTDSEKRAGCMLVDLGADPTTVSVYYKGILRHLSVIPLVGGNVDVYKRQPVRMIPPNSLSENSTGIWNHAFSTISSTRASTISMNFLLSTRCV